MKPTGEIVINEEGYLEIDHLIICKLVTGREADLALQFHDRNRRRSTARGTSVIEIPFSDFVDKILKAGLTRRK